MFGHFFGREAYAVGASLRVAAKRLLLRLRCKEPAEGLEARGPSAVHYEVSRHQQDPAT